MESQIPDVGRGLYTRPVPATGATAPTWSRIAKFIGLLLLGNLVIGCATQMVSLHFEAFDTAGKTQEWRFNWDSENLGNQENLSPYWIVQTGRSLIRDHGDIWDTKAVSVMLAAIHESGILTRSR